MAKKSVTSYENELKKMVEMRKGHFDEWLRPQLRAAAQCQMVLDKVFDEIAGQQSLVSIETGSMGQQKMVASPLVSYYDKLQRTMIMHYEALGINYAATPSKVDDARPKSVDGSDDPLVGYMSAVLNPKR